MTRRTADSWNYLVTALKPVTYEEAKAKVQISSGRYRAALKELQDHALIEEFPGGGVLPIEKYRRKSRRDENFRNFQLLVEEN